MSTSTGGTGSLLGSVEMPYDSRNEWRVAKKQLRKMRQKSLPSDPPSVELQASISASGTGSLLGSVENVIRRSERMEGREEATMKDATEDAVFRPPLC